MTEVDGHGEARQIGGFVRSVLLPVGVASVALVAGTAGYLLYLPTQATYSELSTLQLLSEGFFRSLGFLVLGMGTITSADPLPLTLLTIGRAAGFLFFSYAAMAGIGVLFADQLRPLRVDAWALFSPLPGFDDRGHVIVCGVGSEGYTLANEALAEDRNVVVIETHHTDRTAELDRQGAVVFEGDASNEQLLVRSANLHRATDVFVTAGDDITNGAVVETIARTAAVSGRSDVLEVTARIGDRRLRRTLHEETESTGPVHLRTYDVPEATARELLAATPVDDIDDLGSRVHVWLVGWTSLSEALVEQLLHLMHYPDEVERQVTVITEQPTEAEQAIDASSPALDPEWWDDPSMAGFVRSLFPDIDVRRLPASDMELLSDRSALYETLQPEDTLTIIADGTDERSLRALLSTWGPKLDAFARDLELDAHLTYRSPADTNWTPPMAAISTSPFTDFGDGCSISSVRGDSRDYVARQLALVYHLLYEASPGAILPTDESVPNGPDADIDAVVQWLVSIPAQRRDQYATAVWRALPEYQRESNRYAADHAAVKRRMRAHLTAVADETENDGIEELAEVEHRRWCSEKLLDGWEPLPSTDQAYWETDHGEHALREQRYHPEIRPVDELRAARDGEWEKDLTQVEALLAHPELFDRPVDGRG